jgi:hypothetical protein
MASERDFELLDDYLRHQLNAGERAAFEQRLEADQALKSEYNLQQKIAEGLRQARVSELKTMLNNVPLPAGVQGGTSLLAKFGMGIGASLLVALGIYYFSTKEEAAEVEPQQTIIAESKPEITSIPDSSTEENQPKQEPAAVTTEPSSKAEEKAKPSTKKTKKSTPQEKVAEKPVIDAFDPSEESDSATGETTGADKEETVKKPVSGTKIPVEAISGIKKYNFHYQFKEGKLMLYGSFEKDLYEIMEFFGDNKRTIFLFYKNNFYLLDEQNEKIKPLTAITDPALLQKLRASKAKGN